MTKSLEDRLTGAKLALRQVDTALVQNASKLSQTAIDYAKNIVAYQPEIDHWIETLKARGAASQYMDGLEMRVDPNDRVEFGGTSVKFQHARLLAVQAYISTTWTIADSISGLLGLILSNTEVVNDPKQAVQLFPHFMSNGKARKSVSALLYYSLRETFGWPIGISYAIRNHFFHDAAHLEGGNFFDGPSKASAFKISQDGWDYVLRKLKSWGLNSNNHRCGTGWPSSPRDDLRELLHDCEKEMDDGLGVLVGSACNLCSTYIGFLLGQD